MAATAKTANAKPIHPRWNALLPTLSAALPITLMPLLRYRPTVGFGIGRGASAAATFRGHYRNRSIVGREVGAAAGAVVYLTNQNGRLRLEAQALRLGGVAGYRLEGAARMNELDLGK
jgi:hypothetical protein